MATPQTDERSDFGVISGALRRRLWLIVLATVAAVGASLFYTHHQQKEYRSSAVLLFRQVLLDVQLTGVPLSLPASDPAVESATNVGLVSQFNVRAQAATRLGPPYTAKSLKDQVDISQQSRSNLVSVQATAASPNEAARIANALTDSYLQIAGEQSAAEVNAALQNVRAQIDGPSLTTAQRQTLRAARIKLKLLASLGPQNVHLVQPAVAPRSPSSPKPLLNAIIGGLIGLIIGLALAFGLEQRDRRLRRPEELESEVGLPLLATVPRNRKLRLPLQTGQLDDEDAEPFRQLASQLRHRSGGRDIRSVLITSAGAESGKTTVALHLAATAAAGFDIRVLLLEGDLRRPALSGRLGLPDDRGLSTLLRDGQSEDTVIQTLELKSTRVAESGNGSAPAATATATATDPASNGHATTPGSNLSLLLAGPRIANAAGLLESEAVRTLIHGARDRYDLTVVDGPPPQLVADAIPLAKEVDAVVIVVGLGRDTGPEVRRLRVELERLGIEPIGLVANYARRQKNAYYAAGSRR